jgi:spermidine synthase
VQGVVVVYGGLLLLVLSLSTSLPAAIFPLLALVAGGSAGAAFPLAVALVRGNADEVAGALYGADLVGGCAGALAGALLFVPVLGIPQTCVAVLLVGLAGLLALL